MHILKPLVLASKSPRRIALLNQIGIRPEILPADIPEDFDPTLSPSENAIQLSRRKAVSIAARCSKAIVVGADTIVVLDGALLAKPEHAEDAKRMLRLLSGRTHTVVTGFTLVDCPSGESVSDYESTEVTFRHLPDDEIDEYVRGGSPIDKAGAYGIQDDYGAVFVIRIEGCFYNVVGFPLAKFYSVLQRFQAQLIDRKEHAQKD